jgi:KUP system potassium uptake protein
MEEMNVPEVLKRVSGIGPPLDQEETSFFLSRQTPLATDIKGMALWRERLFAWMMRNAETPMEFFSLPSHRVVELGAHIKI